MHEEPVGVAAEPVVDEEDAHERRPVEDEPDELPPEVRDRKRRHSGRQPDEDQAVPHE